MFQTLYNFNFFNEYKYNDIIQQYKIKKNSNLIDVWGIKQQRKKKLEKIEENLKNDRKL